MEAGRAIQRGFVTPDRTTLVTSTHRVFAMTEKIALGDGRVEPLPLLEACAVAAQRLGELTVRPQQRGADAVHDVIDVADHHRHQGVQAGEEA